MKKNIYFALILCVISCKDDNSVTTTPKVAQENVVENVGAKSNQLEKRYKGSDDIVEEIYQELILNDKELTKLDAKIRDLNNSTEDIIRQYRNILSKIIGSLIMNNSNNRYYHQIIKDSIYAACFTPCSYI